MWHLNNRNKRGVAIDLKSPDAAKIVERLAKWADVFIVNTPHPAREKLKLDYDQVAQFNPRLIYADITGYGDTGPDAALPGFDLTAYWSRTGLLSLLHDAGAPPTWPFAGTGDAPSGVGLFAAIVTALYRRERTGKGSSVTTSLLAAGVWSAGVAIQAALCRGKVRTAARPKKSGKRGAERVQKLRQHLVRARRHARQNSGPRSRYRPRRSFEGSAIR